MIHVYSPAIIERKRRVLMCSLCKRRRRHVASFVEWHGWTIVCCGCGERWQDGERLGPTAHLKRDRVAAAKRLWAEVQPVEGIRR